jgi:hypothetical protein
MVSFSNIVEELLKAGFKAGCCYQSGSIDVEVDEHTAWYFGTADGENWGANLCDDEGHILRIIEEIGPKEDCEDESEIVNAIKKVMEEKMSRHLHELTEAVEALKDELDSTLNIMKNSDRFRLQDEVSAGYILREWQDRDLLISTSLRNLMDGTVLSIRNTLERNWNVR